MVRRLVLIVLLVGGILGIALGTLLGDTSRYATFKEAQAHPEKTFHVIGRFCPGKRIEYRPEVDPNRLRFCLMDESGRQAWVEYPGAPPPDFMYIDGVVVIGKWDVQRNEFAAQRILLKCPSKYVDLQGRGQAQSVSNR